MRQLPVLEDGCRIALIVEAGHNDNSIRFDGVVDGVVEGSPDDDSSEPMIGVGVTVWRDADTPDCFGGVLSKATTEAGFLALVSELSRDEIARRAIDSGSA